MLEKIIANFKKNREAVDTWLEAKRAEIPQPVYSSVDLRNSGFKIAPVDVNLFPAGFNNLCPTYNKRAGELFREYLQKNFPNSKKILIFPEAHTRNTYYLENVRKIHLILGNAGFEVRVGHVNEELEDETKLETAAGFLLGLHRIQREDNSLCINCDQKKWTPDIVLSNNDFSAGIPEILEGISQPIIPHPHLGWWKRSKMENITHYTSLLEEFAELLNIDPWFLTPLTVQVDNVNFQEKEGFEAIKTAATNLLNQIKAKYDEHDITEKPYLFIKNASGTYGMGVHHIESPEDLDSLNRKIRNKLSTGKDKQEITSIIVQEGVPSTEHFSGNVGEPVIYLIGGKAYGGFFRINNQKDERGNLNSVGMTFSRLCFDDLKNYENHLPNCDLDCLEKFYFLIGELSTLAAGMEMKDL